MKEDYYFEQREGYIYIKLTEPETLESCKREALATKTLVDRYKCKKVLADNREKPSFIGTFEEYELAEFYAKHKLQMHISHAAIVFDPKVVAQMKFWEDASFNRGINVRVFSSLEEAERWLKGS
ncbi:MAG: STAS/SEC14 domain-containing protein [Ignavibacteria bacterium]|nr:STAS/SEC14 domain-containing protein [Ignavibacteria bacterium]